MRKTIIALTAAGALLLTACGSSDSATETATIEEVEIIEAEETSTAATASPNAAPESAEPEGSVNETSNEDADAPATGTESLTGVMDRVGVPADQQGYIAAWAPMACQMGRQMGISDSQAASHMVTDLAGDVDLTEQQAAEIWQVAKTTC